MGRLVVQYFFDAVQDFLIELRDKLQRINILFQVVDL
jgi:hypothetical protein